MMNLNQQIYSKEAIKVRMLQNATNLWGVKNTQSLDPLVKLLIDAFSTEVFKANNEIQSINGRIIEKLAKLLTPSHYTHPNPAHAIAYCTPQEDRELLMSHTEFFLKKQLNSLKKTQSDNQVEIPFTPVGNINLIKAQTLLMIAGNTVYSLDEYLNKIPVSRINSEIENYRKIAIGIDFSNYESDQMPEHLSFYCSNPTYEYVDFLYRLLPYVKISCKGEELEVSSGLSYEKKTGGADYESLFYEQSIQYKLIEDVRNIYQDKFIEVSGFKRNVWENTSPLPQELDTPVLENFKSKKMVWLTIEFPPQFSAEMLENFLFVLNAFPVHNRGWKKTEFSLDIMGNNIPLETSEDEFFLFVDEVIDELGKKYTEIPFTPNGEVSRGLYTVRKGGMERFTQRNAVDLMSNVMELLRDEVAAFSILNRDNVKNILGEISIKMKGMMKKVESVNKDLKEDINYVIIEPLDQQAHTYATFWVTNCALANNIRPGTHLNSQKQEFITLLTTTMGGQEEQKSSDAILAYKYALSTRDKIVSIEDAKNYCKMILKDDLKKVTVKRGSMISDKPKEGFIRTVDIEIIPQNYNFFGKNYWDNTALVIKNNIKAKAVDGVEYRVEIVEG